MLCESGLSRSSRRVFGVFVEEMIGLATTLIPESKPTPAKVSYDLLDTDMTMETIRSMRGLLNELRGQELGDQQMRVHLDRIDEELTWLETEFPTAQRVAKFKEALADALKELKSEHEEKEEW